MAGYNYGAGNFQRLREAVCCSLILSTSFCVLWSILIVIFTSPIISCFGKDETMQEIARIALRANTIMFFTFDSNLCIPHYIWQSEEQGKVFC